MATQNNTDKNRKKTSLRSLTPQISGLSNWTSKDLKNGKDVSRIERDFVAAYQEAKRIKKIIAEFANLKPLAIITDKNAKPFAELIKRMHFQGDLRDVYEKIRSDSKLQKSEAKRLLVAVNSVLLQHHGPLPEKQRQQLELLQTVAEIQNELEKYYSLLLADDRNIDHADAIAALNELHRAIALTLLDYQASSATERKGSSAITEEELGQFKKCLRIIWGEEMP